MSTSPIQPSFQGVRQLPNYLWHKWKVQPMAIKGSLYALLAVAGIGTIYLIAQHFFRNTSSAAQQSNKPVDILPNQISKRPFCWNFHFFGPNLNVPILPVFEKYSQGILHFEMKDVLDSSQMDINGNSKVPVTVSFTHAGKVFYSQEVPAGESNANLFLQNLPYNQQVVVQFTAGASVKEVQFNVGRIRGLYQIDQKLETFSQSLIETVFSNPVGGGPQANTFARYHEFSKEPLGLSLSDKEPAPFNPSGQNAYLTLKNELLNSFQVVALQFEISDSSRNPQNRRVSLTVVLDSNDPKNLSEEVIRKHVVDAYKKARQTVPKGMKINLHSLQQIIYKLA